jgi:hypothetical protein
MQGPPYTPPPPYPPPQYDPPPPYPPPYVGQVPGAPFEASAPSVIIWARVYATAFTVMYLLCFVGGIVIALAADGARATEAQIQGGIMSVVGLPLMILSFLAVFAPRKKWGWGVNIAVMGLGCTSCACLPFAIPLLIAWLKPEVKAWYGV